MIVPTLTTARLLLQPLGTSHSAGMFALWSSDAVCRFSGALADADGEPVPSPVTRVEDSDRLLEFWIRAQREGWRVR